MLRGAALVSLTLFAVPTTASPPPPAPLLPPPPLPAPPPLSPGFKCTNTCGGNLQGPSRPRARDGECTDGGPGDTRSWIYPKPICPLGEDCDDCGSRALPPPPAAPPPPPPAPPPWPPGESCSNECDNRGGISTANNGVCEERRISWIWSTDIQNAGRGMPMGRSQLRVGI